MPLTALLRPPRNGPILRLRKPPSIAVPVCWAGAVSRSVNSDDTTNRERRTLPGNLGIRKALYRSGGTSVIAGTSAAARSLRLARVFLAHIEQLFDFCNHVAVAVGHHGLELRFNFSAGFRLRPDLRKAFRGNLETSLHQALAGFLEADRGGFVPNNEVAAQVVHQDKHEPGIGHGIQRSAEMRADVVPVPELERHLHVKPAKILGDVSDADAGPYERRIKLQPSQ